MVFASQSVASIVTLPFWGKMGDKYGQKPMTIRAGFFLSAIYFGMSACQAPWQMILLRFLNGALTGFIPGSMALIATNTPRENAPKAVATVQTTAAIGQIAGPPIGGLLAHFTGGYRSSMFLSGTAVLLCTLTVWIFVREVVKPQQKEKTSLMQDFAVSLRSPIISSMMLAVLLAVLFGGSLSPIFALHVKSISPNTPEVWNGMIYAMLPAAIALSARKWAGFGERRGPERAIYIGLIGGATCSLLIGLTHSIWAFAGALFVAGLFLASASPSAGTIICTRVDQGFQGRAYGMMWSAQTLGALIAPLAAAPIGANYGTGAVFIFVGAAMLLGIIPLRKLIRRW